MIAGGAEKFRIVLSCRLLSDLILINPFASSQIFFDRIFRDLLLFSNLEISGETDSQMFIINSKKVALT